MATGDTNVTFGGVAENARLVAKITAADPALILELRRVEAEVEADRAEVAANALAVAEDTSAVAADRVAVNDDRLATEQVYADAAALYEDLDAVEAARLDAQSSADTSLINAEDAEDAQLAAEAAARQAAGVTRVYATITEGMAATVDGQFFTVAGAVGDPVLGTLYQNSNGGAVLHGSTYSKAKIDSNQEVSFLATMARADSIARLQLATISLTVFPE